MTSKLETFPGTPLHEHDFESGAVLFHHDQMNGRYAWDTGIGIGSYLAALKEGYLLGSYCRKCRRTVVPP
ncbi:MAG: hypothetical protein GTN78_11320, partial [Gemmatimonadales bacterium]|nr:hypothetical protein [Gemmatimonadales bacterium]